MASPEESSKYTITESVDNLIGGAFTKPKGGKNRPAQGGSKKPGRGGTDPTRGGGNRQPKGTGQGGKRGNRGYGDDMRFPAGGGGPSQPGKPVEDNRSVGTPAKKSANARRPGIKAGSRPEKAVGGGSGNPKRPGIKAGSRPGRGGTDPTRGGGNRQPVGPGRKGDYSRTKIKKTDYKPLTREEIAAKKKEYQTKLEERRQKLRDKTKGRRAEVQAPKRGERTFGRKLENVKVSRKSTPIGKTGGNVGPGGKGPNYLYGPGKKSGTGKKGLGGMGQGRKGGMGQGRKGGMGQGRKAGVRSRNGGSASRASGSFRGRR